MILPLLLSVQFAKLDAILDDRRLSGAIVTCCVVDASGTVIFERNPSTRVMPGSNQKLLSTCYALYKLGADYQPETRIWKLRDRVVVQSDGNPLLTHEALQSTAIALGLDRKMPVYVKEAYRPLIGPSWEWDDLPNRYAAPVTALTVDRGGVELWSKGGRLEVRPLPYWLRPKRATKTGPRKIDYDPIRRTLLVAGELPKGEIRLDTLALDHPDEAAASLLGRGFHLVDSVPNTKPDAAITSSPIRAIITECLVKSDNNIAENLLLMAAGKDGPLGDDPYKIASEKLSGFLKDVVGVELGDFHPVDGSGMSRHNVATTRGITKLLLWATAQSTRDAWLGALAKPGEGTLTSRLKDVPFVGKTGTLDMVVALSGYVHTKSNRDLVISLIFNHFICPEKDARSIADQFVKALAENDFGTLPAARQSHENRPALARHFSTDVDRHRRSHLYRVAAR